MLATPLPSLSLMCNRPSAPCKAEKMGAGLNARGYPCQQLDLPSDILRCAQQWFPPPKGARSTEHPSPCTLPWLFSPRCCTGGVPGGTGLLPAGSGKKGSSPSPHGTAHGLLGSSLAPRGITPGLVRSPLLLHTRWMPAGCQPPWCPTSSQSVTSGPRHIAAEWSKRNCWLQFLKSDLFSASSF